MKFAAWTRLLCALFAPLLAAGAASAEDNSAGDFYRGKQVTILVSSDPGGAYDIAARVMSHFLGRYIPGEPAIIVQNMSGAGGVRAVNNIVNVAPKDGTMIGAPQSGTALEPKYHLLSPGGNNAKFDGTKLQWLGSLEQAVYLFAFWHESSVQEFDDLRQREAVVGASTPNSDEAVYSKLVNNIFDTKMKIISGYASSPAIALAMERREIAGALFTYGSMMIERPDWLSENKVRVVIQLALAPFAPLKGVPMALDLVKNDDDRRILEVVLAKSRMARPYFMADGVPAERVAAVRTAFDNMVKDPAFLEEASKAGMLVNPVSGGSVQQTVLQVYQTPEPLLKRVREIIGGQD